MPSSVCELYITVGVCVEITIGVIIAHMKVNGLDKAIQKAGGQKALAELLGLGQTAISNWRIRRKPLPAERAIEIEKVTGVPRHELRPDLWPV